MTLTSLCNSAGWFAPYLVGNPEDRFSHDKAQLWFADLFQVPTSSQDEWTAEVHSPGAQ